ncbi:MAG TPA: response regulator transcription factor [Blastocatellia bacterium]|nr:response regulator transcription factor [Blastocatellia bacterium]
MVEASARASANLPEPLESAGERIKVLLVDDSTHFLESAVRFLMTVPSVQLVGCASSAPDAIEQAERLQPDLILMDVAMPDMNGLEVALHLKTECNPPRIVMLSLHDTPEYRCVARVVGADGYVTKSDLATHLLPLIEYLFKLKP